MRYRKKPTQVRIFALQAFRQHRNVSLPGGNVYTIAQHARTRKRLRQQTRKRPIVIKERAKFPSPYFCISAIADLVYRRVARAQSRCDASRKAADTYAQSATQRQRAGCVDHFSGHSVRFEARIERQSVAAGAEDDYYIVHMASPW